MSRLAGDVRHPTGSESGGPSTVLRSLALAPAAQDDSDPAPAVGLKSAGPRTEVRPPSEHHASRAFLRTTSSTAGTSGTATVIAALTMSTGSPLPSLGQLKMKRSAVKWESTTVSAS